MPTVSTVPPVERATLKRPRMFGLIDDRLSTAKAKSANGRSFTIANAVALGGLGAAIGLPLNSENAPNVNPIVRFLIRWTIGRRFDRLCFVARSLLPITLKG